MSLMNIPTYPATEEGVRALLRAESTGLVPVTFTWDPMVPGVCLVTCESGDRALVYVEGSHAPGQFEVEDA